jgi:hypothetical protein
MLPHSRTLRHDAEAERVKGSEKYQFILIAIIHTPILQDIGT